MLRSRFSTLCAWGGPSAGHGRWPASTQNGQRPREHRPPPDRRSRARLHAAAPSRSRSSRASPTLLAPPKRRAGARPAGAVAEDLADRVSPAACARSTRLGRNVRHWQRGPGDTRGTGVGKTQRGQGGDGPGDLFRQPPGLGLPNRSPPVGATPGVEGRVRPWPSTPTEALATAHRR
jgi:hypothetical protein